MRRVAAVWCQAAICQWGKIETVSPPSLSTMHTGGFSQFVDECDDCPCLLESAERVSYLLMGPGMASDSSHRVSIMFVRRVTTDVPD